MSILTNPTGISERVPPAKSSKLQAWWPCFDVSGSTLTDNSDNSNTITEITGTISSIASANPGRLKWVSTLAYIGVADKTALEVIGSTTSFIITCRINTGTGSAGSGVFLSKGDSGSTLGFDLLISEGGVAGKLTFRLGNGAGLASRESATTGLFDSTDHHVALVLDPVSDVWKIFLDGSDDTSGATAIPTSSPSTDSNFMLGGKGKAGALASGLHSVTGVSPAGDADLFDIQVYSVNDTLPANYADLIAWLSAHPYQVLSTEQW